MLSTGLGTLFNQKTPFEFQPDIFSIGALFGGSYKAILWFRVLKLVCVSRYANYTRGGPGSLSKKDANSKVGFLLNRALGQRFTCDVPLGSAERMPRLTPL